MADDHRNEARLHEHALPGPSKLFELRLGDGTTLAVAVDPTTGGHHMSVMPPDRDTPCAQFDLDESEAAALANALARRASLDG